MAYFWEEICRKDAWLRIFHSFVYVEKKDKVDKLGKPYVSETLIFPRYHQFEAVNMMIEDAKSNGPGQQYLAEHSAGSGKTSTIAWTAHDLIKLRHPDGKAYFNSVIIAGTNGKGSVSHMLSSILQESGLKVGLYTSPHLKHFEERGRGSEYEQRKSEFKNRSGSVPAKDCSQFLQEFLRQYLILQECEFFLKKHLIYSQVHSFVLFQKLYFLSA